MGQTYSKHSLLLAFMCSGFQKIHQVSHHQIQVARVARVVTVVLLVPVIPAQVPPQVAKMILMAWIAMKHGYRLTICIERSIMSSGARSASLSSGRQCWLTTLDSGPINSSTTAISPWYCTSRASAKARIWQNTLKAEIM